MFRQPLLIGGAVVVGVQGLSDLTGVQGLSDLTQYVEELAKVVERPYFRSSQYTFLFLDEGGLKDLPGVAINVSEEIWLEVERLIPSPPPEPSALIKPWITPSSDPTKPPSTKDHIVKVPKRPRNGSLSAGQAVTTCASAPARRRLRRLMFSFA